MRLDALLSPSLAIGVCLSTILIHQNPNTVHGFSFSSVRNDIRQSSTIISNSRHKQILCIQRAIICTHGGKLILAASSSSGDENSIIDATIEEKTAGLASLDGDDGEENTTVSTSYATKNNLDAHYLDRLTFFLHKPTFHI